MSVGDSLEMLDQDLLADLVVRQEAVENRTVYDIEVSHLITLTTP